MTSIEIYGVGGEYGVLSNNYKTYTNIDGETWMSVSNYIYAKALPSIMYTDKIKKADPKDIHKEFDKYMTKTEEDVLSVALLEALRVKFQNPKIMDILLSTGNSPIIYKSTNGFLGDGKDGDGKNMLGNYMVQIRDEVLNEKKREREIAEREELIYKAYLARYALQDAFNKDDDLKEYFDLSFDEIVNKYGREKLLKTSPTKSTILQFYSESSDEDKSFINLAILYPNILIYKIRKDLQNLATRKEKALKNKVFDMYVQDLINRTYKDKLLSNEQKEMYKNKMISNLTYEQFETTKNKVYYDLLNNSNDLQDEIKRLTLEANIPTKEEITNAELINIKDVNFLEQNKKNDYIEEVKLETTLPSLPENTYEYVPPDFDFSEYKVKKPKTNKTNKKNKKSEFMEEIVDSSSSDDGASDDDDEDYEKKYKKGSEAEKKLEKVYQQQLEFEEEQKKVKEIELKPGFQLVDVSKLKNEDYKVVDTILMKSDNSFSLWKQNELAKIKMKTDEYVKENKDEIEQKNFLAEQKRDFDEKIKEKIKEGIEKERTLYKQKEKEAKENYRLQLESLKKEDGTPYFSEEQINDKVNKFKYIPDKSKFTLTNAIEQIHKLRKKEIVNNAAEIPTELINVGAPVLIFAGKPPLNYVIEDYNLQLLSPIYYTGLLKIKNLEYPTICHYLYTICFSLEYEVNTIRDAYNYILNYPIEEYNNLFGGKPNPPSRFLRYDFLAEYLKYVRITRDTKKFKKLAKEALDIKFTNIDYQNILLSTGNNNIIYNDRQDSYLGTKNITTYTIEREGYTSTEQFILAMRKNAIPNRGLNFVGKYLMCLREQILNNRLDETLITANDFNKLYLQGSLTTKEWTDLDIDNMCKELLKFKNGSLIINEWVNSRTDDMCKTILKFNEYYKKKYDTTINFELGIGIELIIKNIYMKAKEILKLVKSVNIQNIPTIYRDRLKSKYKNRFYVYDGIFWSNIFSNILFLVQNVPEPTCYKIERILHGSNIIVSNSNPCLKIIPTGANKLNCIVGAILNILLNIQKIYKEGVVPQPPPPSEVKNKINRILSRNESVIDFKIEKVDIELAVSIILNTKRLINVEFKSQDEKLIYEYIKDIMLGEEVEEVEEESMPLVAEEVEEGEEGEEEEEVGRQIDSDSEDKKEYDFEYQDEYLRNSDEEGEDARSELGDYDYNQYEEGDEDDYGDNNDGANKSYKSKKGEKKPNKYDEGKINVIVDEIDAYIKKYNLFGIPVDKTICKLILNGAMFIDDYKNMSIEVKRNRYNFFSGNQV